MNPLSGSASRSRGASARDLEMSASPALRVLFGATDAVGAHVVHALLSRPGSVFVVDPDRPARGSRTT